MPWGLGLSGPGALDVVVQVIELLEGPGRRPPRDPQIGVSLLTHALQTAQLAERARAPRALVAAALLHDVGHLRARRAEAHPCDEVHELRALGLHNVYVVLGEMQVPAGLFGAHSATFIVPSGVPRPTGDLGHSKVLDHNTMTCAGLTCGME